MRRPATRRPSEHPLRKTPPTDPFARLQGNSAALPVRPAAAQEPAVVAPDSQRAEPVPLDAGPMIVPPGNADLRAPSAAATNSSLGPPPGGDRYRAGRQSLYAAAGRHGKSRNRAGSGPIRPAHAATRWPVHNPGHELWRRDYSAADHRRRRHDRESGTNPGRRDLRPGGQHRQRRRAEGTGQPGGKQLEGPQSPQLTIQKIAPREDPGRQAGHASASRSATRDKRRPTTSRSATRFPAARGCWARAPPAARGPHGELVWTLGTIKPGEESSVEMQLMPTAEGEIGSVATVHFDADASARTIATQPKLVVETTGADRVLIGDPATLSITVSNPGTRRGHRRGVGGAHSRRLAASGRQRVGIQRGRPAAGRKPQAGVATDGQAARRDHQRAGRPAARATCAAEDRFRLEVAAPQLDIAMIGPQRRYLEHQAMYQVAISNPGTAAAQQVELVAYLPSGLKFVSANNSGHYDEADRAVHWRLEELPANEQGRRRVGDHAHRARPAEHQASRHGGQGRRSSRRSSRWSVEGIAAVLFQVSQEEQSDRGGRANVATRFASSTRDRRRPRTFAWRCSCRRS